MAVWPWNKARNETAAPAAAPGAHVTKTGAAIPDGLDEDMIHAVVADFYRKARLDPIVGPVFNRVIEDEDWPKHLAKIQDFWSSMLLGSGRYRGRPMPKHIDIGELADQHFERWLALFRETVETICPPRIAALFVDRAERVGNNFRLGIMLAEGRDARDLVPIRAGRPPMPDER